MKKSLFADNFGRRVHRSRGPRVAHEAFCVLRVRQAAGWRAVHNAGRSALLPALLRRVVRRVLRLVRRRDRRRPGPDEPPGPALARHRALLLLPLVPRFAARTTVPAEAQFHFLLSDVLDGVVAFASATVDAAHAHAVPQENASPGHHRGAVFERPARRERKTCSCCATRDSEKTEVSTAK